MGTGIYRYSTGQQQWVNRNGGLVVPPTTYTRPTGVNADGIPYVTYESLYHSGDTVTQALGRLSTPAVVTFPAGQFFDSDFATGYLTCITVNSTLTPNVRGIVGSGPGSWDGTASGTYFGIKANTSTKQGDSSLAGVTQMRVLKADSSAAYEWRQFAVVGTGQANATVGPGSGKPHWYHAFTIWHPTRAQYVRDLLMTGWEGGSNVPPGETFGFMIGDSAALAHDVQRVEGDARRHSAWGGDGAPHGATPLHFQGCNGTVVRDCYAHHAISGHFGFYKSRNCTTYNCRSEYNGTGTGAAGLSGWGFNHENCDGITHNNPTMLVDKSNGNTAGWHMTHSNYNDSSFSPGTLTVTWDGTYTATDGINQYNDLSGQTSGTFYIHSFTGSGQSPKYETTPSVTGKRGSFYWWY